MEQARPHWHHSSPHRTDSGTQSCDGSTHTLLFDGYRDSEQHGGRAKGLGRLLKEINTAWLLFDRDGSGEVHRETDRQTDRQTAH